MKTRLINVFGFTLVILLVLQNGQLHAQSPGLWGMTSEGGVDEVGTIFNTAHDGTGLTVQHSFAVVNSGGRPYINAQLIQLANGKLYGVTSDGGKNGVGVLFEYDPATGVYVKKFDFSNAVGRAPMGSLALGTNGKLYGIATAGGTNNLGTIFEYDLTTNTCTKKIDLSLANGHSPYGNSLCLHSNGKFYGMTLYGGSSNFGVLFEYDAATNTYTKKIDFTGSANGAYPYGGLMVTSAGKIFGVTSQGGVNSQGTLFEYVPGTNTLTKKVDFTAANGSQPFASLAEADNNRLYGVAALNGSIFEYNPATNAFAKKVAVNSTATGSFPYGTLAKGTNGKLYGVTVAGGASSEGTIFEYDVATNTLAKKIDFVRATGSSVYGGMTLASNGNFYGLTYQGGESDMGVLFEYNSTTNTYTSKIDFELTPNGSFPFGGLVQASNQKFYGMTIQGGIHDAGVIFEFDRITNLFAKKYDFDRATGAFPQGNLTQAPNGKLYGMTSGGGGPNDAGVIFEFDPSSGAYTMKHEFDETNGAEPIGSLLLASNNKLYGTTSEGGTSGYGVLFEYDPATNAFSKKVEFDFNVNGFNPYDALIEVGNGKFFGLGRDAGLNGNGMGTLFEYDLATNTLTKRVNFLGAIGESPEGSLVKAPNGKLYGVTRYGGANSRGVLFEYDIATDTYTKKFDFGGSGLEPAEPAASLALSGNGKLYGSTLFGGTSNRGVIFEYDPATSTLTTKQSFIGSNGGGLLYGRLLFVKGEQTITFNALADKFVNVAAFSLSASSSASLPITYTSSNTTVATVSGSTVTIVGPGTTTITASQAGDANYNAAASVSRTLTVNKLDQTITFGTLANKTFGDADFTVTANASSGLAVNYISSNTAVATVVGNTITIISAGTTTITASQSGNATYNAAADVAQTLTVNKLDQTITFGALDNKSFGDASFTLNATASSGLPVSYTSSNTDVATISGGTVTIVGAGTTTITATQVGNANYNAAPVSTQSLTVGKASQSITFSAIADKTIGDVSFSLTATANSSLPVTFSSTSNKISISGAQVTIQSAGRVTITAAQGGNSNYNAAPSVDRSFCINPAKPTIAVTNGNTAMPTLTSSASAGNQWYFNGAIIPGATSNTYAATQAGVYKVKTTADDCASEFSNDQALIVTGDLKSDAAVAISLYPNPAAEWLIVKLGDLRGQKNVSLVDMNGKQLDKQTTTNDETRFNVSAYHQGMYWVQVHAGGVRRVLRFVKE